MEILTTNITKFIPKNDVENYISQLKFDEKNSDEKTKFFIAPNAILAPFMQTRFAEKLADAFEDELGNRPMVFIHSPSASNSVLATKQKSVNVNSIKAESSQFITSHTFESFIVGGSNQVAYSACLNVATQPQKAYKIVFIYGSTGLGKSHLLNAIGNCCVEQGRAAILTTGENFTNDFIKNVTNKTMAKFKQKYRNCDVLLIDDIQFLAKSEKAQDEFFHTFNEIHDKGGYVVLASDKPPKQLNGFEDRLKSRFEWELCTDITPPELETKICIIKAKCDVEGIELSSNIVEYIAANMGDNIREIQSAIVSISAHSTMTGHEITLDFAKTIIKDQIKERNSQINLNDIISVVAKELSVRPSEITGGIRTKQVSTARQICSYLAKNLINTSTVKQLAHQLGMSDHSVIVKNNKKIEKLIDEDSLFKTKIEEMKNKILSKK